MDGGLVGDTPVLQRDVVAKLGQRSGPAIVGVLRNLELSCKRLQMPMCRLDPSGQEDPTSGQVGICMIFLDLSMIRLAINAEAFKRSSERLF